MSPASSASSPTLARPTMSRPSPSSGWIVRWRCGEGVPTKSWPTGPPSRQRPRDSMSFAPTRPSFGPMLLKLGRPAEAASAMQLIVDDHPFRERPVALLMRALAADGRHADALREFERLRGSLGEELGLEPSPELRAVEATILRHEANTRPLVPAVGVPGNSFVGRQRASCTSCSRSTSRTSCASCSAMPVSALLTRRRPT